MNKVIAVLLITLIIIIPIMGLVLIDLPARAYYNKKFGAHVVMAYEHMTKHLLKEQKNKY